MWGPVFATPRAGMAALPPAVADRLADVAAGEKEAGVEIRVQ
jgi:hypothetical protein